jgi:hypothetical protein
MKAATNRKTRNEAEEKLCICIEQDVLFYSIREINFSCLNVGLSAPYQPVGTTVHSIPGMKLADDWTPRRERRQGMEQGIGLIMMNTKIKQMKH